MEETGRAGIATFVMRGREYLVALDIRGRSKMTTSELVEAIREAS